MSVIHLQNVQVLNPKGSFSDPYIFKVTFECISPLEDDIEWKLIYVGSAESASYDQELDNCMVGPVPVGVNSFEFEADAPHPDKIPTQDLLGVTVILLTGSYRDAEFIRVGYYVNNFYEDPALQENPPEQVDLSIVKREVLAEKPRVTRFNVKWDADSKPATLPSTSNAMDTDDSSQAVVPPPAGGSSSSGFGSQASGQYNGSDGQSVGSRSAFAPVAVQ
ncbi:anti-silence-domain-containing protein [Ceraceosorus guamensis]|uniref:Anti-silencing function protein 1 n=1 Tax=Ceraceosorus guamensis TaxID=1522189 RepID=A0A316W8N0_9BASI|nr:anti-silence-domain-containing protein [Ceraceosorus guamensis]PWN46192.1 anti-silence-domain-containing protein [Ceraceosorus guamensis]